MSIEQAIERAKRLQRERVVDEEPRAASPHIVQAHTLSPVASAAAPRVVERGVRVHPTESLPHLPVLAYDAASCERERILLSSDAVSDDGGAMAAFRILRTRVQQRVRSNGWYKLAITSPGQDEGKSNMALNLALSIAREKNNDVFLIDLDMRNPSVCNYLGVHPQFEIVDFFDGKCDASDLPFRVHGEDLIVAGSTRGTDNSSELLATGKLEELLHYISSATPRALIIIDLPPLLKTDDALVVLPAVDATLLVVAEGKTRRDGLERALELLSDYNVAGIAMNQTQESIAAGYEVT